MVDLSAYKYPWGNIEPHERYIVIDPITKGGWFASEWRAQPAEVRALGMVSGYWAVRNADEAILTSIRAEVDEMNAGMNAEQLAFQKEIAKEELEDSAKDDNALDIGPKSRRKGRAGIGRS